MAPGVRRALPGWLARLAEAQYLSRVPFAARPRIAACACKEIDMFFQRLYDAGLAQASYIVGCQSTGEALVVDPIRDIAQYLDVAAKEGLRITHVSETHIHADFVSGARELANATGARLLLSDEGDEDWKYAFAASDGAQLLHDGDHFIVG